VILWDAVAVLPILAYSGVGAFRTTVMNNVFESADASKDSFGRVTLPAAAPGAALAAAPETSSSKTFAYAAGGAAVVAAGAWWLWRRKSRPDDGIDETA